MNREEQTEACLRQSAIPAPESVGSARAELRRRLLLRGLVGAPVALAAMRPIKTLAKATKYCKKTGWASFEANMTTSITPTAQCKAGYTASYYTQGKNGTGNWPDLNSSIPTYNGHTTLTKNTNFATVFGSGSGTLLQALQDAGSCTVSACTGLAEEGAFVAAYFNALKVSGYPLTTANLFAIWAGTAITCNAGYFAPNCQSQAAVFFQQLDSMT